MKKLFLPILLMVLSWSLPVAAEDIEHSMCSVTGYYEGNGNRFLYELAARALEKNRFNADSECSSTLKFAKEVGVKFSKPGRVKIEEEAVVISHAEHFSNLVYDAILSKIRFD
jgi:hypothetical protein